MLRPELLQDLRQQQPGADDASSESHKYLQDQDIEACAQPEDQEQTGDREQDRCDGIWRDHFEDRRKGSDEQHRDEQCKCLRRAVSELLLLQANSSKPAPLRRRSCREYDVPYRLVQGASAASPFPATGCADWWRRAA